jgi:GNAT superfamily N-acetyltransferase
VDPAVKPAHAGELANPSIRCAKVHAEGIASPISMKDLITLRPVTSQDDVFMCEVYASTRAEELAQMDMSESEKQALLQMQFTAQHRYYQEHFRQASFQIILSNGRPAGRLYIDRNEKEIRLIDITLLTEYRNKGIGRGLLQDLLLEARQTQKPVRLHVEKSNPALRLYKRLGFTCVCDNGVYYFMEWIPQ